MYLLKHMLGSLIHRGDLIVVGPDGRHYAFGDGKPPRVTVAIADTATARRLVFNAGLALGESYMDERFTVRDGTIYDFLDLVFANLGWTGGTRLQHFHEMMGRLGRRLLQNNRVTVARRNVAHHYDLSGELYDLFLDADRQYSCAYYRSPDDTLEQAQAQKKRHIAAKLCLDRPDLKVLDIGCGWGGLGLYLAEAAGATVSGITLSEEQLKVAQQRAEDAGLADRVSFRLQDYREERGRYDRIVSVGMFEHVGVGYYRDFFRQIAELLSEDGVALVHTIGRAEGPGRTNAWIRKYIFPGGYSPALSEILPVIEHAGLYVTDIEVLRLHYAETLKAWRQRFTANRARIARLYDERFCRLWEFYLAASEATFRHSGHINFQIQLAKKVDALPITRDYMIDWERAKAADAISGIRAAE